MWYFRPDAMQNCADLSVPRAIDAVIFPSRARLVAFPLATLIGLPNQHELGMLKSCGQRAGRSFPSNANSSEAGALNGRVGPCRTRESCPESRSRLVMRQSCIQVHNFRNTIVLLESKPSLVAMSPAKTCHNKDTLCRICSEGLTCVLCVRQAR